MNSSSLISNFSSSPLSVLLVRAFSFLTMAPIKSKSLVRIELLDANEPCKPKRILLLGLSKQITSIEALCLMCPVVVNLWVYITLKIKSCQVFQIKKDLH